MSALLGRFLDRIALALSFAATRLHATAKALAPAQDESARFQKTSVLSSPNYKVVLAEADRTKQALDA